MSGKVANATPKAAAGKPRLSAAGGGAYRRTSSGPLPSAGGGGGRASSESGGGFGWEWDPDLDLGGFCGVWVDLHFARCEMLTSLARVC